MSDPDIESAGIVKGAAKQSSWEMATAPGETDELAIATAIEADPECVNLYELGWSRTEPTRYVDRGLKRWPDDNRLLRRKAEVLWYQKASYAAFLIYSELLRRYPDMFMITSNLPELAEDALPAAPGGDATKAPKPLLAALEHMKKVAARYPLNWQVQWNYANILNRVAMYLRGDHTMDKIPREIRQQFGAMADEAAQVVMNAARLRPDCSELLRAMLYICFHAGQTDPQWQRTVIKAIHAVDPTNVDAEMYAAFSHSIGWGNHDDFWSFIQDALKNHPNDAKAMSRIAGTIGTELTRQLGWKAMTPEEVYKTPNKMSDQFIACAEFAMNNGVQVEKWVAGMLREMYRQRHGEQKVNELVESGKHWALTAGAADEAQKKGDWERSLRLSRLSMPINPNRDSRERTQYNIVKSLWKLKRYDEALTEARIGMVEFPEKQTFHYMFAVVANEKGDPLEEAYKAAYTAVDITTTNTGANETFEKLRTKLNKPPHPKLKP